MKTFIHNFKLALTQSELYRDPSSFNVKGGLLHILGLSIILSIVSTIYIASISLPLIKEGVRYGATFAAKYPENLVLTLKGDTLTMNVPSPYEISYTKLYNEIATSTINLAERQNRAKNFIVIDADHEVSLASFDTYNTDMLLGKDGLISKDDAGSLRVNYYKNAKINELVISKTVVTRWNDRLQSLVKQLSPVVVSILGIILVIFSTIGTYIGFLVAALLGAVIVKLAAGAKGWKNFPYIDGLKIALYAVTVKAIINLVSYVIPLPWFFTAALFTALVVGLIPHKETPPEEPQEIEVAPTTL